MNFKPKQYKIAVLAASWKSPELLKYFIPSILDSFTEDNKLCIALNEADIESIELCSEYTYFKNFEYIVLRENYGHLAIDFFKNSLNSEYVMNTNDDMFYISGWDKKLISLIEKNPNISTVSPFCVEPRFTGNPAVVVDDEITTFDENSFLKFKQNVINEKYKLPFYLKSYNHPIMCRTKDFLRVNGYSDGFDLNWWYGGGLDDWFAARMSCNDKGVLDFSRIGLIDKDTCVYHGISMSQKKQSEDNQKKSNGEYFKQKCGGMSVTDFCAAYGRYNKIELSYE